MDQELLMKQIVEQVMAAMKNGTPASAPAAASSCGSKVTAANYPLAESMADQIKTPTGKDFTSLSYEKVINGELSADDMRIAPVTLEMQAQVAESVHREAFAGNLRRAAELIDFQVYGNLFCVIILIWGMIKWLKGRYYTKPQMSETK